MSGLDISKIQELIRQRRIIWKRHALERMLERGLTRSMVLEAILTGELIEDYTEDRPFPTGLFLGWQVQSLCTLYSQWIPTIMLLQ